MTEITQNFDNFKLVNPYNNVILYTRLLVPCNKLNTDIYLNIKNLLKKTYEGKCIKYGYISTIFKIIDYSDNNIEINNLDCSVHYNVKYSARVCFPIVNTIIIARVSTINKQLLVAENGPIKNMIKNNNINYNDFKLDDNNNIIIKATNKNLEIGNFVKILIKAKKMNNNDDKIGTLCHLIGIATQADINNFYEKKNRTEDINDIVDNDLSGDSSSDDILEIPDEIDETDSKNISNLKQDQEEDDETDTIKNFIVI